MPIHQRHNSKGSYYQYGNHGAKYYYTKETRERAYKRALRQARAIHSHGGQ